MRAAAAGAALIEARTLASVASRVLGWARLSALSSSRGGPELARGARAALGADAVFAVRARWRRCSASGGSTRRARR